MTYFWTTADEIPALPGAYVLAISLSKLVVVSICRKPSAPLAPGCYLYCGSAKGPGGLRARVARHVRHGKAIRWHVDGLTEAGTVLGAWTFPGGDECDLVAALSHLPVPIEGFGSTDCRRCRSHLLRWPDTAETLLGDLPLMPIKLNTYGSAGHRRKALSNINGSTASPKAMYPVASSRHQALVQPINPSRLANRGCSVGADQS